MRGKSSGRAVLLLLALAANSGVWAGPPQQHQAVMTVSATVVASCMHTSSSAHVADTQADSEPLPPTLTVSCTPGSGKLYTARIENSSKTPGLSQTDTATAALGTADTDSSTRVFTISAIKTVSKPTQTSQASRVGGEFIKISLNY